MAISFLFRLYQYGKLITAPSQYKIALSILDKSGAVVFSASTEKKGEGRILFLEEAYMYIELPENKFELLLPYDIHISIYQKSSHPVVEKTIKSVVLNCPKENHNGKEFEVHIY